MKNKTNQTTVNFNRGTAVKNTNKKSYNVVKPGNRKPKEVKIPLGTYCANNDEIKSTDS